MTTKEIKRLQDASRRSVVRAERALAAGQPGAAQDHRDMAARFDARIRAISMTHTATNCAAQDAGICERIHVGDIVKVVAGGPGNLGYMQSGNVVAVEADGVITVNFPDGVLDLLGELVEDDLMYSEAELEKLSV